jgi:hypothetical protein
MPVPQDGHTASVTFGTTTTFTAALTSIAPDEVSREVLDVSHLGTTQWRAKIPSDLGDSGGFAASGWYSTDLQPPVTAVPETITLTLPTDLTNEEAEGPTIAGTGFVDSWSIGEITSGAVIPFDMHITWSAGPTYTPEDDGLEE